MFDIFNKKTAIMLSMSAMIALTGCQDDEAAKAPAPEPIDLTQTEDLFSEPVQPNPLTSDPEAVIVRVNGEDITRGEILEVMQMAMQQMAGRVPPEELEKFKEQMYSQIKNDLITKKLLDMAVTASGLVPTAEEISETIESIKTRIPEGQTLEDALAAQNTTMEELTDNIRQDMATRMFLESRTTELAAVTEEEALGYYEENGDRFVKPESVSASHILVRTEEGDSEEAKAQKKADLEKLRADIIAGVTTFEEAAKEHSDCPSSAQGGSLGTFGKGQMVPEFEIAAFTQEIDEIGDIIETQFGYHIVQVSERSEEGTVSFEEAKDRIVDFLTNQKKQQAVADYIKSLRDSATIEELTL